MSLDIVERSINKLRQSWCFLCREMVEELWIPKKNGKSKGSLWNTSIVIDNDLFCSTTWSRSFSADNFSSLNFLDVCSKWLAWYFDFCSSSAKLLFVICSSFSWEGETRRLVFSVKFWIIKAKINKNFSNYLLTVIYAKYQTRFYTQSRLYNSGYHLIVIAL